MRHSLANIVALATGFALGVLLMSVLYSEGNRNASDGNSLPCLIFNVEGGSKIVKEMKDSSSSRDNILNHKCTCGEELDRLKRLARVALFVQNYTKFRNCLGDLAPTAPIEDMDAMMAFLYPPNEDPIVDFRDSRRKLFRPGTRNEPLSLKEEYVFKRGVLVGVLTQQEYLSTRARTLYETWGREVDKLILFVGEDCNVSADLSHLPIVKLEGVPDHVYPPLKKAFAVMKYMYSHHVNEFKWFIRADDDMYLRTKKLTDLLNRMNPYEQVYLGRAGAGRKEDLERLELLPHERYCMGGPGVILSNGAMRGVGPHLDNCLNAVLSHDTHSDGKWNDDDVEIGRCLSRKVNTQCSSSAQARALFKFDYSGDTLTPTTLWTDPRLEEPISIHPVKNPNSMRSLHHFYKSLEFQHSYDKLHTQVGYLNKLCKLLPPSFAPPPSASVGCNLKLHPQLPKSNTSSAVYTHLGYTPGGMLLIKDHPSLIHNPRSKFDLLMWTRFNNSQVQDILGPSPQHFPLPSFRYELLQVLNMLQAYLQAQLGTKAARISHVLDGYTRFDPHIGREYLLTVKLLINGANPQYRKFHLIREVTPDFSLIEEHISLSTPTVHVILPLMKVDDTLYSFLVSYGDIGLRYKENKLHLIVVVFSHTEADQVQTIIDDFTKNTFQAQVSIVTAIGSYNRLRGIEVAMATLESSNSLVFLADVDVRFSSGFFRRCRSNAILNHRVYFPVAFWLFDSAHNNQHAFDSHHPPKISPTSGEWGYYNHWLACLYKADYESVGGYKDSRYTVELFERVSASQHLEVMHAPDPGLYHMWGTKNCREIKSVAKREVCTELQAVGRVQRADMAQYLGEMLANKKPFEMGERIT